MAMVPQEGNSNTPCFLIPPFLGDIKPPAIREVVDFWNGLTIEWGCLPVKAIDRIGLRMARCTGGGRYKT